jgi:hypothetical protein
MLPFPPVVAAFAAAAGLIVVGRVLAREWRRINGELHPQPSEVDARPPCRTLRRDPTTGVYRIDVG